MLRRMAERVLPSSLRPIALIGVGSACIVALIAAFTVLVLEQNDHLARVSAERRAERLAKTAAYELDTKLTTVDRAMRYAGAEILKADNPDRLAELGAASQLPTHLLREFVFVAPDGHVLTSAMDGEAARQHANLSILPHFRRQLDDRSDDSSVSVPVFGVLTTDLLLPVSRSVRHADGSLMGVLMAMVDTTQLEQIWLDIGLEAHDTLDLKGTDGKRWLRWSNAKAARLTGQLTGDASDRLVSFRQLDGWPLIVSAEIDGRSLALETAPARQVIVAFALGSSSLVILFSVLLVGRTRQAAREHAAADRERAIAERERDTAETMRARLLAAIDAVPVEFVEYDSERRLVLANRAARNAQLWIGDPIGKRQRELLEESIVAVRKSDPDRDWESWIDQRLADIERGGETEVTRPTGETGRFYSSVMPGGGRVVVRVDITEIRRREAQLAAEMERLSSIFQSTGAGILLLDRETRVIMANQFVLNDYGKTAAEVIGQSYGSLAKAGLDPAVLARWQGASGTQRLEALEYERHLIGADGAKRLVKVTANPVQDEAGRLRYIVIIGVDDTERRLAEIRLFDSSRLANLGEMATGMAHEINQPLAVIRMAADSVIEELDGPEAEAIPAELAEFVKAKLARISIQTERASTLVNELRTVARKPANDSQPFDVVAAVHTSGDLLREQLKAGRVALTLDLPSSALMARGESGRLQQVIINLALNARDALLENPSRSSTGTLGHIAIRVAPVPAGGVALTVEDDGPGIPSHVLPRLFEPFFTTKPAGKGTGLGLSISHDIIKRMGGEIAADNRPGGGARFTIVLPPLGSAGKD
jgi:PAS domain S-box-containing protein